MRAGRQIAFLFFFLASFSSFSQEGLSGQFRYSYTLLQGKWHVVASNFGTWTEGDKTEPGNVWSDFKMKGKSLRFNDLLTYKKNGKLKTIKGKLKQKKADKLHFVWRGKGALFIFKSKWQVIASDGEGEWLVLYSPGTLTSAEGVDIVSRTKNLSEKKIQDIISHIKPGFIKKPLKILKR